RNVAGFAKKSQAAQAAFKSLVVGADRGSATGRVMLTGQVVHIPDVTTDREYALKDRAEVAEIRTVLGVPLLREDGLIGVFGLTRGHVEPFTDKQIELVRTFADQAVITMENARLITETREALDQQ